MTRAPAEKKLVVLVAEFQALLADTVLSLYQQGSSLIKIKRSVAVPKVDGDQ
jgi:hypothetical protein